MLAKLLIPFCESNLPMSAIYVTSVDWHFKSLHLRPNGLPQL
jgi:hypothetical protein